MKSYEYDIICMFGIVLPILLRVRLYVFPCDAEDVSWPVRNIPITAWSYMSFIRMRVEQSSAPVEVCRKKQNSRCC